MKRNYKCPVCGAPVEGEKCEYCGCVIYDFANISADEPTYIRMRINDPVDGKKYIFQFKAIAVNPQINVSYNKVQAVDHSERCVKTFTIGRECTMSVEFRAVEDNGVLFELIDADRPYKESWRDDL